MLYANIHSDNNQEERFKNNLEDLDQMLNEEEDGNDYIDGHFQNQGVMIGMQRAPANRVASLMEQLK